MTNLGSLGDRDNNKDLNDPASLSRPPDVNPLAVHFRSLCEIRAHRWARGDFKDLPEAVDLLQDWAFNRGLTETIGQDAVQQIMADAFAPHRGM